VPPSEYRSRLFLLLEPSALSLPLCFFSPPIISHWRVLPASGGSQHLYAFGCKSFFYNKQHLLNLQKETVRKLSSREKGQWTEAGCGHATALMFRLARFMSMDVQMFGPMHCTRSRHLTSVGAFPLKDKHVYTKSLEIRSLMHFFLQCLSCPFVCNGCESLVLLPFFGLYIFLRVCLYYKHKCLYVMLLN
jgi:hypothetical protein